MHARVDAVFDDDEVARAGRAAWPTSLAAAGLVEQRSSMKLLQLTAPGRARRLPGQRAVGDVARRPRQPPPGRLRTPPRSCSREIDAGALPADRRDRRRQAARHRAGAPPAPRPARAVHRLRAADRVRRRPPTTSSRSTAAARSPSRPACPSASPRRAAGATPTLDVGSAPVRDVLTGREHPGGVLRVADLLAHVPRRAARRPTEGKP